MAVTDDTRMKRDGPGMAHFLFPQHIHSVMGTIVRESTRLITTNELIMSHAQVLSLLNLFGLDTSGIESVNLRVWRENDTFLGLGANGAMTEVDSINFSFQEATFNVEEQDLTIIGVDFSPPI